MEIAPEVVISSGALIAGFVASAVRTFFAWDGRRAALTVALSGVLVAFLMYYGGMVAGTHDLSTMQISARAVLAGFLMGATASGDYSWKQLRGAEPSGVIELPGGSR